MKQDLSFGRWLKHRRRGLGLTQRELGQRVGYAEVTVRKIEADEQRPSRQMAERLAKEMDIAPQEREHFIRFARDELDRNGSPLPNQAPPLPWQSSSRHASSNLPAPLTTLVGRENEAVALQQLLRRRAVRLVTLTGPGGVGKTRLGIHVAATLLDDFADGVFFVNLAPIDDPGLIAATIAKALDIQEHSSRPLLENLKEYVRHRQMLLLLDNFEQLVAAAPLLTKLLEAAPQLKLLVTSREVLHLYGEYEFPVSPLPLPELDCVPSPEALLHYAAVELFIERARAVQLDYPVTGENLPVVGRICTALDGLPLAIELAAARAKLFPPQPLLARLDRGLGWLAGGARNVPQRHQTLHRTIEWSYNLLDEGEQRLFRRLGVFVGCCSEEAARIVCTAPGDLGMEVLDGLTSLADKSLLAHRPGVNGEPRFAMLKTIQEYAMEHLAGRRELEALQRAHADYYLALVEAGERHFLHAEQPALLERLELEHDNLRAALRWTRESGQAEMNLRLVGALWRFWYVRGYLSEGREQVEKALAQPGAAARTAARAKALNGGGWLAWVQGDYTSAHALATESLAIRRELGDKRGIAGSLGTLGRVAYEQCDYSTARSLYEEALLIFRELGERWGIAFCLNFLGSVAIAQEHYTAARSAVAESLTIRRELGDEWGIAGSLNNLGLIAYEQGDYVPAHAFYVKSLTLLHTLRDKAGIASSLEGFAALAAVQGNRLRAARLWGAAEAIREAIGVALPPHERTRHQRASAATESQTDQAAFAAAWAEGRTLNLEQAIAYALD